MVLMTAPSSMQAMEYLGLPSARARLLIAVCQDEQRHTDRGNARIFLCIGQHVGGRAEGVQQRI